MKTENGGMEFLNAFTKAIRETCRECKWSKNNCICIVCEDRQFVLCELKHKHVDKYDVCENFEGENVR